MKVFGPAKPSSASALTYRDRRRYLQERRIDLAIAVFALLDLIFGPLVYNLIFGGDGGGRLPLVVMVIRQLIVTAALLVNVLRFSRRLSRSVPTATGGSRLSSPSSAKPNSSSSASGMGR